MFIDEAGYLNFCFTDDNIYNLSDSILNMQAIRFKKTNYSLAIQYYGIFVG